MAQQENAPNKPVHLIYLCGGLLLFFLIQWSIDWIVGYFRKPPSEFVATLIAFIGAFTVSALLYRNDRVHSGVNEVASELKKVTWPTAKEVKTATIIVIVMSIVMAVILFVFDFTWSNLTELVYG